MKRHEEIRMLEREIRAMKRYDFRAWLGYNVVKSGKAGVNWLIVAGGDVRGKMNVGFSDLTAHKTSVVSIDGVEHTVVEIKDSFLPLLERAKDFRAFYRMLTHYVDDADIRRWHYDMWLAAHNLEAKVRRLVELQTRSERMETETEREVFRRNTLREAAKRYGAL